jgi:hypothetical protein
MSTNSGSSGTVAYHDADETQALRLLALKQGEEWMKGRPDGLAEMQAAAAQWMADWALISPRALHPGERTMKAAE